jgi:hypothetical protein
LAADFGKKQMTDTIQQKLSELRRQLTGWLVVHGLGRWLVTGLIVVGCSILLDRIFKMDIAQRSIVLVAMLATAAGYFFWLVLRPLFKKAPDDALILEVEKKYPELRENLISSWQLARQAGTQEWAITGTSETMAQATIASGISKAGKIDFGATLDRREHAKDWALLGLGLLLTAGLLVGIGASSFLHTWFRRNILLTNDSWPQATYLEFIGLKDGKLLIPRGADHRQFVNVSEDSSDRDVKVTLELDLPGGRNLQTMKPTGKLGGREHVSLLYNVSSEFRLRALGGDDTTDWVEVELVEPPAILELKMHAILPEYTGISQMELAGFGPHAVLRGSSLDIEIAVNKSLQAAKLQSETQSNDMNPVAFEFKPVSEGRLGLRLNSEQLVGGEYSIVLVDQSGLENVRPTNFEVTIKEDQPPKVRASLLGISGIVVPQASLPTSYHAADEYGLARLYFETRWASSETDEAGEAKPIEKEMTIAAFGSTESTTREVKDVAVLDLRPLQLQPGMSFRFSTVAADSNPKTPGIGKSQEFLLRVVSNEELRADLLRREIEQRKAFEQAYEKQMELASELQLLVVKKRAEDQTPEQVLARREQELIALVRNQKGIGTGIAQVADRFEEFLVEIKNNRLDEAENELFPGQTIESRFDGAIIQPIRKLDQELVALATRNIDNCRAVMDRDAELTQSAAQTGEIQQQILTEMRKILSAMSDSENFQEIINDLLRIKDDSQGLKREIKKQSKPEEIFDDPNADIFDK